MNMVKRMRLQEGNRTGVANVPGSAEIEMKEAKCAVEKNPNGIKSTEWKTNETQIVVVKTYQYSAKLEKVLG